MPAYNAARTLRQTYAEVREQQMVDTIILVDDGSRDETVAVAREPGGGAGPRARGEQRLRRQSEDLLPAGVGGRGGHRHHDSSRLPVHAEADSGDGVDHRQRAASVRAGQPHSGRLRVAGAGCRCGNTCPTAFSPSPRTSCWAPSCRNTTPAIAPSRGRSWRRCDLAGNSDDFVFDNQMLAQILWHGFTIAEVSCPTKYFPEASSINLRRSIRYGFGCLGTGPALPVGPFGSGGLPVVPRLRQTLATDGGGSHIGS